MEFIALLGIGFVIYTYWKLYGLLSSSIIGCVILRKYFKSNISTERTIAYMIKSAVFSFIILVFSAFLGNSIVDKMYLENKHEVAELALIYELCFRFFLLSIAHYFIAKYDFKLNTKNSIYGGMIFGILNLAFTTLFKFLV